MRNKPFGRTFDLVIQTALLAPTLFCGLYSLFIENDYTLFFALGLFFIGAWQLLSAFCWGFLARFPLQLKYLASAVIYILVLIGLAYTCNLLKIDYFSTEIYMAIFTALVMFIPAIAAIWYWLLTYRLWANYAPKSFWDLV